MIKDPNALQTPVIAEADGWTLASGSASRPTAAELTAQLTGGQPAAPAAEVVAEVPAAPAAAAAPVVEEDAAPLEAAAEVVEGEPPAAPVAAPKKKEKGRVDLSRQRIEQLNTKLRAETEARQQEAQARQRLEAELATLRAAGAPAPAAAAVPPVAAAPVVAAAAKPEPAWSGAGGYEEQGKPWEEFSRDHMTWVRETALAEATGAAKKIVEDELAKFRTTDEQARTAAAEASARSTAEAAHNTRVEAARAAHPDFQTVVDQNLTDITSPFIKHMIFYTPEGAELMYHLAHHREEAEILNDYQPTRPMVDGLRRTKNLIKVMSHLAAHPDEFQRLTTLDPIATLLEIGSMDREAGGAPAGSPPAPRISHARPPVRPVTGAPQAPAAAASGTTKLDDLEFGPAYIAEANRIEQQKSGGRRAVRTF